MPEQPLISFPKIRLPRRRSDTLSRLRLLDELNDNLIDHTLNLIAAPAGSGKTTLLVDYAHQQEMPVCWYALDELDCDLYRFVTHFIASLQQKFPEFGELSNNVLADLPDLVQSMSQLVVTLINDIYHHISENFVIILDDYHLVHGTAEVDQFVNYFVQQVSDNCHLVLAARTLPTFESIILLTARQQLYGFDFEHLAFQPDEVQALILQNDKRSITLNEAVDLVNQTEGWATGLTLSPARHQKTAVALALKQRQRSLKVGVSLDDYFDEQVFALQPSAVQTFLLNTSILEAFDTKLCQEVFGLEQDYEALIQTVIENNLFVISIDLPGHWIRYHHLFRDFLQNKLQQSASETVTQIQERLAIVYTKRKDWDKAQALYQEIGNYEAIAKLIEDSLVTFGENGRFRTLIKWIDELPNPFLETHVKLLAIRGILGIELGDTAVMELLTAVEQPLREQGETEALARLLLARSMGYRVLRCYQESLEDAEEILALIGEQTAAPSAEYAGALRQKGLHLYDTGHMDDAQQYFDEALQRYEQLQDLSGTAIVYLNKGMAYRAQGAYQKAEQAYQLALDRWASYKNIIRQANVLNSLGVLQHTCGDYQNAYSTLEQAITDAQKIGSLRIQAFALTSLGDLYLDLEAFTAAHTSYDRARLLAEKIHAQALLFYLDLAQVACWRRNHQLIKAQVALDQSAEGKTAYERGMYQRECGLLALAQGDASAALAHLTAAQQAFDEGDYLTEQVQINLYTAVAAAQTKNEEVSKRKLKHAFYLAHRLDNQHVLFAAGYQMRHWLTDLSDSPQAQQLRQQANNLNESNTEQRRLLRQKSSTITLAPATLQIQTLGTIQIYQNNEELTSPEWQKHKIVKALLFLLLEHTRGFTKEEIGVYLWPDASPQSLKTAFKNALYRLRIALGKDVVHYDEVLGRYSFNRTIDYTWDVELMHQGLANATAADNPAAKLKHYLTAFSHYHGDYLPLLEGDWVENARARLARQYRHASLACGELALHEQTYEIVTQCGHNLLRFDKYDEEAYRLLMRAYAAQGNKAEMQRQYLACEQALMVDLALEPSIQTKELYFQLS